MKELKTGDLVWVSNTSEERARQLKLEKVYLYKNGDSIFAQDRKLFETKRNDCCKWEIAIPIPKTETRVKRASEIMRMLEDRDYKVDNDGNWYSKVITAWNRRMWITCGRIPSSEYTYLAEWLEEVEVE